MVFLRLRSGLLLLFFFLFIAAFTQVRPVVKGYVFSQLINEGVNRVDENGNSTSAGLKTKIYIYLEVRGSGKPMVSQVRYNSKVFNDPTVYSITGVPAYVGSTAAGGKKIVLSPARGNHLWRIEFTITENQEKPLVATHPTILVKGSIDRRAFTIVLKNEVALAEAVGM